MKNRRIKLYYQPVVNNLGDMLSPRLVTAVTGRDCIRSKPQGADLVAVGSLLDKAMQKRWQRPLAGRLAPLAVWGTGFLYPGPPRTSRLLSLMAVRGSGSSGRIKRLNGDCALGDPALLTGRLFPQPASCSNRRILLVPSLADDGAWIAAGLENDNLGADYLPVTGDTDMLLLAIANADIVITSAMHAIIVAMSYGVPAIWVAPDQGSFEGGSWKYYDFYSAFGMHPTPLSRDAQYWANVSLDTLMEATVGFEPGTQRISETSGRLYEALTI
jgi:pyruvyltransferase